MKLVFNIEDLQTGDTYKVEFSHAIIPRDNSSFWYMSNMLESTQPYFPTADKSAPLWNFESYKIGTAFESVTDQGVHTFEVMSCE